MRLLKIIHGYPPDYNAGSEVYSQSICNELSQRHQISIFTREENPYLVDYHLRKENINTNLTKYVVNKKIDKDTYQHHEIDNLLEQLLVEIEPDVAHIGHLNHLSVGIVDVLRKRQIPIVFTLHDFWLMCPRGQFLRRDVALDSLYSLCDAQHHNLCAKRCYACYFSGNESTHQQELDYWASWVAHRMDTTQKLAEHIDLFLAPSNYLRERFINEFNIEPIKIKYLDYGFPLDYLKPLHSPTRNIFTFGYIGTHIPAKGINLLIEAFMKVKCPCKLIIWGRSNGQSTKYLKQLASLSTNPIEFRGEYVNQNLTQDVFAHVDSIIVPSIWGENSPLVIHEAQACHIPVITANFGGMKEYVKHLHNGLLFEHRSANDLAKQMQFAINEPQLMRQLGRRGYLYSLDGSVPTIQSHCAQLELIYQQLLKKRQK